MDNVVVGYGISLEGGEFVRDKTIRTVSTFNTVNAEFVEAVRTCLQEEGVKKVAASWGVTGRAKHELLAIKLSRLMPDCEFEIDYERYKCEITKK